MSPHTKILVTVAEVSEMIGLGQSTIWRKVKEGVFPAPIKIGGATRWHRDEIEAHLKNLTAEQRDVFLTEVPANKSAKLVGNRNLVQS